jgi:hypothetical protein
VAHFKAGPDRQLFVAPNLGSGSFNHLSQAGDLGVIFSDGLASGNQNQGAGLVLAPWTGGWARGIRIDADGKVGIGTAAPQAELDVEGDVRVEEKLSVPKVIGEQNGNTPTQICAHTTSDDGSCISLWGNGSTTRPGHISLTAGNGTGASGGEIRFLQNLGSGSFIQNMVITAQGEVGIGINNPTATLHVAGSFKVMDLFGDNQFEIKDNGFVTCRQVDVNNFLIPDYVFKSDYKLMPLNQLKNFIETHHHLPGIKSEDQYNEVGSVNLGELSLKLLEKIEELTLYTLEQQEKIDALNDRIEKLVKQKSN